MNTAEATQTLAHMNFLAASTLAAIGTQCALRVDAHQQIDLGVVEQPLGLVDGDVGLGLRVGIRSVTILWPSTPPFSLIMSMAILLPIGGGLRAAGSERTGQVVDDADLDFLGLGKCRRHAAERHGKAYGGDSCGLREIHRTPSQCRQ